LKKGRLRRPFFKNWDGFIFGSPLQKAAHDFGGERAEALNDVNKAITELQNALAKDPH